MTPAERHADSVTDAELFAMSLHRERGPMVVEDVAGLPASPLTVAEGTVLAPALVPDRTRALWLIPTPELQRARLARRGHLNRLYTFFAGVIEQEARGHDMPILSVDGSLDVDETVAAAEQLLGPALAEGPRAETAAARRALLREANEAIVAQVRGFYARPWASGDAETISRSFVCECGDPSCDADVESPVGVVAAMPALAPGHAAVR
jgi:hypothetical protein